MDTIPLLDEQKGKILVLHNTNAPAAKKQKKTWIHFIRDPSGKVLKGFSPPAPPPGTGPHTYRYVLVKPENAGNLSGENIQNIPEGEEIQSFVVNPPSIGGRRKKTRKLKKSKKTRRGGK
jgi:hypothetical protein